MNDELKKLRGFAAMDKERVREIASKGGIAAHQAGTAHVFTKDEARSAGKKGGVVAQANRRQRKKEVVSQDVQHPPINEKMS